MGPAGLEWDAAFGSAAVPGKVSGQPIRTAISVVQPIWSREGYALPFGCNRRAVHIHR